MGYEEDILVFPDNWRVVLLFNEFGSQWLSAGMGGKTGLVYATVYMRLDRVAKDPEDWEMLYTQLRVLEQAALKTMAQNAETDDD